MTARPMGSLGLAFLLAAAAARPAAGQTEATAQPDLRRLFPRRAEIFVETRGLSRLLLPPEVLAECQAELSDLRVVDRVGREVPYLVDGGPGPETAVAEMLVFEPELEATSRQTEQRESAPDLLRETYRLRMPDGAARRWDLVVDSRRPRFVRRLEVRAVGGGVDEGPPLAEGSVFRLQDPLRERSSITLPPVEADSLVVTLEGEDESFLEPAFRLEASRVLPEREQVRVDLEILDQVSRAGRTVVELERPRGLVPDRLAVATTTGSFNRRFEVWDHGPGGAGEPLGGDTLYRLGGAVGVERTEIPLRPATGDRLRIVIEDGDSPPLEGLTFRAVLRRPALIFELGPAASGEAAGELLFGGARAYRPRYDLTALLAGGERDLEGEAARVRVELRDLARLATARLGPIGANPRWDPSPALVFAMRPGAKIATWRFEHRRALPVPRTAEGLLRLPLDPETVARCRGDLADLRVVDGEARQWPYLLEAAGSPRRIPLLASAPRSVDGISTYLLELPASPLRLEALHLDGRAPYFDRPFELRGRRPGEGQRWRTLAQGRLTRRPDDPGEVVISVGGEPLAALELRIRDGNDAPLEWGSIEARVRLPEIYFAAPEGDYALLFGEPEARRPRYELERVRDLVLAVGSIDVQPGELEENPDRGPFSRFRGDGGWQQAVLWAALVLAALVLTWITLRLARHEPPA